ncbi:hypothetical protein DERP_006016 [Dermatophagoides pteronyssinus]|uniref:Uncharacterized protein n=1 Tax=Dermatophagoides pteronyssinus TaxID=6956 RepID=A0ABQ8JS21_DERPT|nr:hypothetical protein DERP_006016 [Dermatophagoides pteronyssinus]
MKIYSCPRFYIKLHYTDTRLTRKGKVKFDFDFSFLFFFVEIKLLRACHYNDDVDVDVDDEKKGVRKKIPLMDRERNLRKEKKQN